MNQFQLSGTLIKKSPLQTKMFDGREAHYCDVTIEELIKNFKNEQTVKHFSFQIWGDQAKNADQCKVGTDVTIEGIIDTFESKGNVFNKPKAKRIIYAKAKQESFIEEKEAIMQASEERDKKDDIPF